VSTIVRSRRAAPAAAVVLGALTFVLALANVPLDHLAPQVDVTGEVISIGLVGAGAVVGTVVAARRPRNPIGWILLAIFLLVAPPYAQYAALDYRMHHGTLPLGRVAVALLADWPVWLVLITILLWLFPDGGCRRRGAGGGWLWFCSPSWCHSRWHPRPVSPWPPPGMPSRSTRAAISPPNRPGRGRSSWTCSSSGSSGASSPGWSFRSPGTGARPVSAASSSSGSTAAPSFSWSP
jgi:hypothetical protein